jgi:hypothetical protein
MDDTLIYGLGTLMIAFLSLMVRYLFKSKCSDVDLCCGLIAIKRDIREEIEEQKLEGNHNYSSKSLSIENI